MKRSAFVFSCLLSLVAWAEPPDFERGGVVLGLQYGLGLWGLDRAHLAAQVGDADADAFVSNTHNAQAASVRLGYNILGHATVEAALTATGWNLADANRGGGGFLIGAARWHPLALVYRGRARPAPVDASVFFGAGYGIVGQARGMDGALLEAGLDAEYFVSKSVGLGLFVRDVLPLWKKFYVDYENRNLPGASLDLPQGSGGSFVTLGVALVLRFET